MARKKPKIDWFSPLNQDTTFRYDGTPIATDMNKDLVLFGGTPYENNLGNVNEILTTHGDTKAEIHTAMSPAGWYLYTSPDSLSTLWLIHFNPLHHAGFRKSKKFYQLHINNEDNQVDIKNEYSEEDWDHQPQREYSLIQETAHMTGMISRKVVGLFEVVLNWRDFPYNEQQMNHFSLQQLFG